MQKTTGNLYHRILDAYRFDLRAFAISRIMLGLILIYDYLDRLTDLTAHYTDAGVLPLHTLFAHAWKSMYIPLHAWNGSFSYQLILFLAGIVSAVCFTVGYKTRFSTVISWILLCSLHNRNPLILQAGDDLLRVALFWGMFIPWGKRFSLDAWKKKMIDADSFSSMAAIAFMIQVASVYFFSALQKSPVEWLQDGTAIYYALSIDQMVFPLGKWLLPHMELTKWLTRLVYISEFLLPLLYIVPFRNKYTRLIACVSLCFFHVAINMVLFIGLFSVIGIAVNLALLPSFVFDRQKILLPLQHTPSNSYKKMQTGALGVLMGYMLLWNMGNIPFTSYALNDAVRYPGYLLRLDQNWGMFAPSVFKNDGWYVMPAKTIDGDSIDLYRDGKPVTYQKPENVLAEVKNDRWRKYNEQVLLNAWCRKDYCRYILIHWNDHHPLQKCSSVELVYVSELTKPVDEETVQKPLVLDRFTLP